MDSERETGTEVVKHDDVAQVMEREGTDRSALPTGMLEPVDDAGAIVRGREKRSELIADALQEGRDYGSVKGIPKPFLQKPGAERLTDAFGCYPRFRILDQEVDHDRRVEWEKRSGKAGTSRGLYRYVVSCDLVHRASGIVVGNGMGSCSTMEDKYVESPRNSENTCLKMAKKRAHVDAALSTFGLSEMFTQDEDYVRSGASRSRPSATSNGSGDAGHTCPECDGPIWDNRPKIESGDWKENAPKFTCKDKDGCGWKSWESEDEVFGDDEGYEWADPLESFPELQSALTELESLNPERAADARAWAEGITDELADSPQRVAAALERIEKACAEEREEEDDEGPTKDDWEDRTETLAWFRSEYGDEWETKLNLLLTRHPDISAGGSHERLDRMGWNTVKRFVETHGAEGVEDPRQMLEQEALL